MGAQHPASHATRLIGATLTAGALLLAPVGVAIATPSIAHAAPPSGPGPGLPGAPGTPGPPGGGPGGPGGSTGPGAGAKPTKARDQRGAAWRAAKRVQQAGGHQRTRPWLFGP